MDKKKVTIICVSIGAVGLIIAAVIVMVSLADRRPILRDLEVPLIPQTQQQYYTDPPQTYAPTDPLVYYIPEPAPTAPPQTMPPQTAPPATAAPVSGGWAVEVWKEGNPPPIGVAFFTDFDKAKTWAISPTQGWKRGSDPIPYNGDKVAYLVQFGLSDPSTYNPVEITP